MYDPLAVANHLSLSERQLHGAALLKKLDTSHTPVIGARFACSFAFNPLLVGQRTDRIRHERLWTDGHEMISFQSFPFWGRVVRGGTFARRSRIV